MTWRRWRRYIQITSSLKLTDNFISRSHYVTEELLAHAGILHQLALFFCFPDLDFNQYSLRNTGNRSIEAVHGIFRGGSHSLPITSPNLTYQEFLNRMNKSNQVRKAEHFLQKIPGNTIVTTKKKRLTYAPDSEPARCNRMPASIQTPAFEQTSATEHTPASEQTPASGHTPAYEQTPATEHASASEQTPATGHTSASEQTPASGHTPASEQAPASGHTPASEQAPASGHTPASEQAPALTPASGHTPASEQAPASGHTSASEQTPATEHTPASEQTQATGHTPASEQTPATGHTPASEQTPANEHTCL